MITRDPDFLHSHVHQGFHRILLTAHPNTEETHPSFIYWHRRFNNLEPHSHYDMGLPMLAGTSRLGFNNPRTVLP